MDAPTRDSLVVPTKLTPPRPQRHTLPRPRLTQRLLEATGYRLAIVQGGTGYGKSTALAALAEEVDALLWYHLDAEDADPLVFLHHLLYAVAAARPGIADAPQAMLEAWERSGDDALWAAVVDRLVAELARQTDQPLFLVLDDAHLLNRNSATLRILDRLAGRAPATLHPILSTRYPLKLPTLVTWRVKGELLEIGQEELAFTPQETMDLFRHRYDYELTREQAATLVARTEGWPIALPLVWQRLQSDANTTPAGALGDLSGTAGDLFAYLAQEVLAQQPDDVRAFLLRTAVLREMTPDICDCLRDAGDSAQLLRYLLENGLFVVDLGNGHVRYHHLFRDFLSHQLDPAGERDAHRRAAHCYRQRGDDEAAVHHFLAAGEVDEAASLLERLGRRLIRAGRLDRLAGWLDALPPAGLENHPALLAYMGDIARLHSRFDEALGWYRQAEERSRARGDSSGVGQALRGQARVYLDTVNPSEAEQLLQEAMRLADGQEDRESRARLLELMAENLVNRGRFEEAEQYQAQARELRQEGPGEADLPVRLLLRTGRLEQARRVLSEQAEAERQEPVLRPRAHRETLLLLSLVHAFQGEREAAYRCAVEGTERGQAVESPFITAVGHMRQGHAWLLQKDEQGYAEAARCFREAIAISETLLVPRLKVEANWGLCQALGFRGELEAARQAAEQGLTIAHTAGDEWVAAWVRVTLGAALVLPGRGEDARPWLDKAGTGFRECGDTYGEAVVRLWQCLLWHRTEDEPRLERDVAALLELAQAHGYGFLFRRKTLLGPPDPRALIPLLLFAREADQQAAYAERLLGQMGLAQVEIHPGYQLRVQTLGPFRLWRGNEEVSSQEWRRKKARQLFQLFLTHRHQMLHRERITGLLWPELDAETAERDFKIAYSALCRVVEPERKRNAPSAFVARDGSRYGLRLEADLWLDVAEFDRRVAAGDAVWHEDPAAALDHYRPALALYQGEFLEEYPYEEWCSEERERLLTLYLRVAERVAGALLAQEAWEEAIEVAQAILARDDCWEQAYRTLMIAYDRLGERAQALRTYRRCADRLQAELGVDPSPATVEVHERIRSPL